MFSLPRCWGRSGRDDEQSQKAKALWGRAAKKVEVHALGTPSEAYQRLIAQAKRCVGHGQVEGAFPEEWDVQLLVDCGRTEDGHRLVLFCPKFLVHSLDDPDELDLAMRFVLLSMDAIAMHGTYVFVYCCLGLDWTDQRLMEKLRFAYECLPRHYSKNLKTWYILHCTSDFKVQMWTFRFWLSQRLWDRIEYTASIEVLCSKIHPSNEEARADLCRRFPQMVQCRDAELLECDLPVTFGVALEDLCNGFGVDFTDKTTGRWYPRLPPALVFLCEVMEREAADEDFGAIFSAKAPAVYQIVEAVDHGRPFPKDIPSSALWCVLKLFLDCLPAPLLSFEALEEIVNLGLSADDTEAQLRFLQDLLHHRLPRNISYVTLYLVSFLHTLCKIAESKTTSPEGSPAADVDINANTDAVTDEVAEAADAAAIANDNADADTDVDTDTDANAGAGTKVPLTFALATKTFTSNFLRPPVMTEEWRSNLSKAYQMVETLLRNAEDARLWIGSMGAHTRHKGADAGTDSSDSDEAGSAASTPDARQRFKLAPGVAADGGTEASSCTPPEL